MRKYGDACRQSLRIGSPACRIRPAPRCALAAIVAVVLALAAGGCGEAADTQSERLAQSLQEVADDELTTGPGRALLDSSCEPRGAAYDCDLQVDSGNDA